MTLGDDYPDQPPAVRCETPIYHPNIDPTCTDGDDNICLNLFGEWQSNFGLEDCVQGFLFLLHNPNLEDPLSPLFESTLSEEEFKDEVSKTLIGDYTIDGVAFEKNWHLSEDIILELCDQSNVELSSDLETGNDVTENNNTHPASESNEVTEPESENFNETTNSLGDIVTDVENPHMNLSRQSSKIERLFSRDEQASVDNMNNEINREVIARVTRVAANVPNNGPCFVDSDPIVKLITIVLYSIGRKVVNWYYT